MTVEPDEDVTVRKNRDTFLSECQLTPLRCLLNEISEENITRYLNNPLQRGTETYASILGTGFTPLQREWIKEVIAAVSRGTPKRKTVRPLTGPTGGGKKK
jgi:hypothetical protein